MRITATLKETFIPKFNGNQDLPESEQIRSEIDFPAGEDLNQLKAWRMTQTGEVRVFFDTKAILRCVKRIHNLEDSVNGKVMQITNGKELGQSKNPKLRPLIDEHVAYVTKDIDFSEDDEKNSEPPVS